MLSDKALQEFKEIWLEEIGEEISDERATELGINLLTIFDKLYSLLTILLELILPISTVLELFIK